MTSLRLTIAGATIALASLPLQAQIARPINAGEIDAHIRFLSSDLLEGRGPATHAGEVAPVYIASVLETAGVKPGGLNGSWYQPVPIDIVSADRGSMHLSASGKATTTFRYPDDVVVWAGSANAQASAHGELVFVGYGAAAPEYKWDDFKNVDMHGKVLLVLVNDPPATAAEPALFGAKAMTYYGRWTYKFEEAERRGAAGMLIVHTTERAGYPWHTVVGSWAKEQRMLPRDSTLAPPLGVRGWITDTAARALLAQAGLNLDDLVARAASRDFQPVSTGIMIDMSFQNTVSHLQSENVVGLVTGSDPRLKNQYVTYSAHWDHLGVGPLVNGDSIYNGALDNASGVADILAVARAAAQGPPTRRSQLFIFVTGEESGLLGSEWFAEHPTVPASSIIANLNVDGGNLLGRARDLDVLGANKSSLGASLARFVSPMGMTLSPEAHPEQGHFYRSDHFSFAKAGIPAISLGAGDDFVGRPKGWGEQQNTDYTANRYHQPSDEYQANWDLSGAVQLANIVLQFGRSLANSAAVPTWNKDAEFHTKK